MKHSNPRLGEFTPTSLTTYLECPRKYYFQKCLNFCPKSESNAKEFGSAIHEMVSTYYKLQNIPYETRKLKAIQAFIATYDKTNDTIKRSMTSGLLVSSAYCDTYKNDNAQYLTDMVETELVVSMPFNTMMYLRQDRLLIADGFYTVVDTKTTTMALTEWYWKEFLLSFQLSAYHYATLQTSGHCDNIQIDAIKVYPKPEFQRRSMQRTENQINDWLNTYKFIVAQIMDSFYPHDQHKELNCFYQNTTSCSKYSGCPYLSVCQYGLTHPDVQVMFTTKETEE